MESLPLPDDTLLTILYELPLSDLDNMAQTSTKFKNLISDPEFINRKGQYLASSLEIPLDSSGDPVYGATNWKDYIISLENVAHIVRGLIQKLRVMDEPDYLLDPDYVINPEEDEEYIEYDDNDIFARAPAIYIKFGELGEISIDKRLGDISVAFPEGSGETYLWGTLNYSERRGREKTAVQKEEEKDTYHQIFRNLRMYPVQDIEMTCDRRRIFWAHFGN